MVISVKTDSISPLTKCPKCGYELYLAQNLSYDAVCPMCQTVVRKKGEDQNSKTEDDETIQRQIKKEIVYFSIGAGFLSSLFLCYSFGKFLGNKIPYVNDGLCDVCKIPASYVAYAGSNFTNLKPINEFCFFHALQWGMGQMANFIRLPPFEILQYIFIVCVVLWVACTLILYKIFRS